MLSLPSVVYFALRLLTSRGPVSGQSVGIRLTVKDNHKGSKQSVRQQGVEIELLI